MKSDIARLLLLVTAFAPLAPAAVVFTPAPDGAPPWPVEDVYTMADDGTNVRALTNDGHSHDPAWSPDGKRILFVHDAALQASNSESDSHHPVELYVMDRNGANRRLIRRRTPVIYSAAWSPDGKMLAVNTIMDVSANRAGLVILSADGSGQPRPVVENAYTAAWSPDGNKIAVSIEQPRGRWSIHVLSPDGSGDVASPIRQSQRETQPGRPAGTDRVRRISRQRWEATDFRDECGWQPAPSNHFRSQLVLQPSFLVARWTSLRVLLRFGIGPLWQGNL